MRILFTYHFPLDRSESGQLIERWAHALTEAGHQVHLLIVDHDACADDPPSVRRIACRPADPDARLCFDVPYFRAELTPERGIAFDALTDRQLSDYRDTLRRQLDDEIDRFDPHIIHGQHVWIFGQLALETGVPYVLNAWGPELDDYAADARYCGLADQAAENAGRILIADPALAQRLQALFEGISERIVPMTGALTTGALNLTTGASAAMRRAAAEQLVALYQTVLDERFGESRSPNA